MEYEIKRYSVRSPLLKNYIQFFWELKIDHLELHHKLIPQRNINLRFNLSDTPQYLCLDGKSHLMENVFFSGLYDSFSSASLKSSGRVDMFGICFLPDGVYPFLKIPVSEFKNIMVGADEAGLKFPGIISERLKETNNTYERLAILEYELTLVLKNEFDIPDNFRQIFRALSRGDAQVQISEFCIRNNIGIRTLERLFNKYTGLSASTFGTLNRFQNGLGQLLREDFTRFSDLAYDNGYFDQVHYIKDFKRFAGNTPKNFIKDNGSILQIGKLT